MCLLKQSPEQRVWKINLSKEERTFTKCSMFISLKMAKHSENYAEFLEDKNNNNNNLDNASTEYEVG